MIFLSLLLVYGTNSISKACYSQAHNKNSGSFRKRDNLTEEEKELITLRKENKHLKMEVDILKQASLILGRKGK